MKLLILGLALFSQISSAISCGPLLAKAANTDLKWRDAISHELPTGQTLPSDAKREKNIQQSVDMMKKEIDGTLWGTGDTDTPPMIVVPTSDTSLKFTKKWEEYGDMHAEITGAKDGVLRATVLLPVSGHTGMADAAKWAKTDTFDLKYKDANGKEVTLVKGAKSLDFVTAQEVEIPLVDGKPVTLLYYRSGSGGPSGYAGGRVLHLTWKKAEPQAPAHDYSKPFWEDRH